MGEAVRITDVSPRDGLQNEASAVSTRDKARLVRLLSRTGVDEIEVTSFVSPKWVPQLGDASELLALLRPHEGAPPGPRPTYSALVPNMRGMESACAAIDGGAPLDKIAVFTAASETFSRRNTNATIDETLDRFRPVIAEARRRGMPVRGYVSCVVACPYEGRTDASRVAGVAAALAELGVGEIDLGDTIGAGTARTIAAVVRTVREALAGSSTRPALTVHLHDTFGRAADGVRAALDEGVRSFDGAAGGLGGCPYASAGGHRAPGNIDTALLVRTVESAGYETGVDPGLLTEAGAMARGLVGGAGPAGAGP